MKQLESAVAVEAPAGVAVSRHRVQRTLARRAEHRDICPPVRPHPHTLRSWLVGVAALPLSLAPFGAYLTQTRHGQEIVDRVAAYATQPEAAVYDALGTFVDRSTVESALGR